MDPGNGQAPLLVTASGAGTTQSDVRLYANAYNIGQVDAGTLVNPVSQTFPFPGFLGGVSVAGGSNGQLFVSPNTGASLVSAFNLSNPGGFGPGTFGGTTLAPGITVPTGFNAPTDIRLGSADVNGDGVLDVLTSSVGATSATPISAFSLNNGGFTALNALNGFQGFGFFGNTFVGSSAFTGAFPTTGSTVGSSIGGAGFGGAGGFANQGLAGVGTTQGLQGGGFLGTASAPVVPSFTATNSTGFFNFAGGGAPGGNQLNNGTLSPGVTFF
jgi:hypothetical protein